MTIKKAAIVGGIFPIVYFKLARLMLAAAGCHIMRVLIFMFP
jgi:hypothetical protein